MAQTPNSNSSSYCTAATALKLFDAQFVGGLVLDDNTQATAADLVNTGITAGANFAAALDAAAGELEASCTKGQRYDPTDLAVLTGVSAKHRDRIIASLALGNLMWRRDPSRSPPPVLAWAESQLGKLEKGEAVFGLTETQEAGTGADVVTSTPDDTAADTMTGIAARLFGGRSFEF